MWFQQAYDVIDKKIDKIFPAPPKKARVSYPLAAFATRKPALFCVPLVSENEGSRQSKIAPGGVYTCEGAQSLHEVATPPRVTDMVRPGGIWCYTTGAIRALEANLAPLVAGPMQGGTVRWDLGL